LALGIAKIFDGIPGLRGLMKVLVSLCDHVRSFVYSHHDRHGTRVARFLVGEFGGRFIENSKSRTGCLVL